MDDQREFLGMSLTDHSVCSVKMNFSLHFPEDVLDDGTRNHEDGAKGLQNPVKVRSRAFRFAIRQGVVAVQHEDAFGHAEKAKSAEERVIAGELRPIVLEAVPNEVETDN